MSFVWETPEEIDMALAQRLSRICKRRKLSQMELNEGSKVSYGSIRRFETGGYGGSYWKSGSSSSVMKYSL